MPPRKSCRLASSSSGWKRSRQRIALGNPFAYAQLVVTGHTATGERFDVTRMAAIEAPASLVKLSPTGLVRPVADGTGMLKFRLEGVAVDVPIHVTGQKDKYEVSFVRDVMPTLSRLGCNAGTCHGAAQGKNGSSSRSAATIRLRRPRPDRRPGRPAHQPRRPDNSLMLLKPPAACPTSAAC